MNPARTFWATHFNTLALFPSITFASTTHRYLIKEIIPVPFRLFLGSFRSVGLGHVIPYRRN